MTNNRYLFGIFLGSVMLATVSQSAEKKLDAFVQAGLQDVSVSIAIEARKDPELKKIGKDYVTAFKLTAQQIQCKEPDRFRFQGRKGILTFRTITNGYRKLTEVTGIPLLRQRKSRDISQDPGKADTVADLGILSKSWVARIRSEWRRQETRNRKLLSVFDYWYRGDPGRRHTLWIDPGTRTIVEQVYHERDPRAPTYRKRIVYSEVKQINGIWMPTRATIYNGEGREAAVMRYARCLVNTGLSDKLFSW